MGDLHLLVDGEKKTTVVSGKKFPTTTAIEELIRIVGVDLTSYRETTWDIDLKYTNCGADDITAAAELLTELEPVSAAFVKAELANAPHTISSAEDYNSITGILQEPVWAQNRLRNIFAAAFDETERETQTMRYGKLIETYPELSNMHFLMTWERQNGNAPFGKRIEFAVKNISELVMLELHLYFTQSKKRIARCVCCGEYFIPATKKETLYCDRVWNGKSCKELGPNLMRMRKMEQDGALAIYEEMRRTLSERANRYENAAESERDNLIPMTQQDYWQWIDMARELREKYKKEEISSEDFLRSIDIYHLIESYNVEPPDIQNEESVFRRRVKADIDFDPWMFYQPMMTLDLSAPDAQWEYNSTKERMAGERVGDETLKEKYRGE